MAVEPELLANAIRALAMDAVEAANSRPSRHADGHGRRRRPILFTEYLKHDPADPELARPRPLRAVGRPRLDADLRAAPPHRLRPADDRRHPELPPARHALRRPSREFPARRASRRRPGRSARASPWRSAWRSPSGISTPSSATIWSITAPGSIAGDGCLMEGINHEAVGPRRPSRPRPADRAVGRQPHHHRRRDRSVDLARISRRATRAAGWHVGRCDGLDFADVRRALDEALADPRPSLIACRTIIGFGAPQQAGHRRHPRRGARRRRGGGGAQAARLGQRRRSRFPATILAAWREAGDAAAKARTPNGATGWPPAPSATSSCAGWRARLPDAVRRYDAYLDGLAANPAEGRDPQGLRAGARGDQRRRCPRRSAARPT